jgi:hypothetical protein
MALRASSCLGQASIIRSVSSAYWTIGKSQPHLSGRGRERIPFYIAKFTTLCSKSAARTNKRGDKGSHCLTPLIQWNTLPDTPLRRMAEVPILNIIFIHFLHLSPKPLCCNILKMTSCSILSNAFSKSNFRITISFFDCLQR